MTRVFIYPNLKNDIITGLSIFFKSTRYFIIYMRYFLLKFEHFS